MICLFLRQTILLQKSLDSEHVDMGNLIKNFVLSANEMLFVSLIIHTQLLKQLARATGSFKTIDVFKFCLRDIKMHQIKF